MQNPSSSIKEIEDGRFEFEGVIFRQLKAGDTERTTTSEEVVILKPPRFLSSYDPILGSCEPQNVLEVGVAEGGSLIYFALAFPSLKFVGVDLREENPAVLGWIDRLDLRDRVSLHYRVDQADRRRLRNIVESEFGDEKLGVIIDDASHFYAQSRMTFESTFDYLRGGGVYCLEDWSWAHEPGRTQDGLWEDRESLSTLLFQLIASQASTGGSLIDEAVINKNVAFLRKGGTKVRGPVNLDNLVLNRGRPWPLL